MSSESVAVLRSVKLTENALSPTKESPKAAGFNLRSAYDLVIPDGGKELIKTDLEIKLPTGCYVELHFFLDWHYNTISMYKRELWMKITMAN